MPAKKISIIGLGLIGGSIAKALKKSGGDFFISAYDTGMSANIAFAEGVIDKPLVNIEESLFSDLIFIAVPVTQTIKILEQLAPHLSEGQIITDVSGVKLPLRKKWGELNSAGVFVGGHPMTGKEKGGYENSDPLLFENAVYILEKTERSEREILPLIEVIKTLGARITFLEPRIHDMMIAYVSHLPQLLAVELTNLAAFEEGEIRFLDFAAGGFRDLTRIASSPFDIWKPVIELNKKEIIDGLDAFVSRLNRIKNHISKNEFDLLGHLFDEARKNRDEIPKDTKGFLNRLYDIFVFVNDEPGVISKISTKLFENNINIKDIELLKIREGSGGTFRLSFETAEEKERAEKLLKEIGY